MGDVMEAEPADCDELLRFRLLHIESQHRRAAEASPLRLPLRRDCEVVEFFMLIREGSALWAEPADCKVCLSPVAGDSDIHSAHYRGAAPAPLKFPPPATSPSFHAHHPSGVFRLERGEVKRFRSVRELLEAEPSYTDELLRFRLLHIEA